jgi:protease-4
VRAKQIGLVDELGSLPRPSNMRLSLPISKIIGFLLILQKVSKFEQIFSSETEEDFSTRLIQRKLGKENFKIFQHITDPDTKTAVLMESPFSIKIN